MGLGNQPLFIIMKKHIVIFAEDWRKVLYGNQGTLKSITINSIPEEVMDCFKLVRILAKRYEDYNLMFFVRYIDSTIEFTINHLMSEDLKSFGIKDESLTFLQHDLILEFATNDTHYFCNCKANEQDEFFEAIKSISQDLYNKYFD